MLRKIVAISDLHGLIPAPEDIPECDFLLIGGDICPNFCHGHNTIQEQTKQLCWLNTVFKRWLDKVPARHVIATWGNHDWVGQFYNPMYLEGLRWHILVDQGIEIEGVKFWGTPWQVEFCNWAFNLTEQQLAQKWALIPNDTDIIVFHSPPYGILDHTVKKPDKHFGSPSQLKRIKEINPVLVTYGHFHNPGIIKKKDTTYWNGAWLNDNYDMCRKPELIEIDI